MTSLAALRVRFDADREDATAGRHDLAAARLEQALDAIGWRSAGGCSSEEVAAVAVHILDACVNGHRDIEIAARSLAELLYSSAVSLDGSMSGASAFVPAAEEVLARYAGAGQAS